MIPQVEPDLTDLEAQAAYDVIESGWVNEGRLTEQFAQEFAKIVGVKYAVPTTSCTAAMALTLMALGIKEREVIVPDITMIGTAMAVLQSGNVPVVVDVNRNNGCIDPDEVTRAITGRTAAIMPVHVNGRSAVGPDLLQIARDHDLQIVEDAACCLGSTLDLQGSTQLGTFGVAGCFSLAATKIVTTGQGGVIATNDAELYEKVTRLKDWGRFQDKGSDHPHVGFNFKFTDIQAAVGLKQLTRLPELVSRKKHIYQRYKGHLEHLMFTGQDYPGFCPWYVDIKGQHFASQLLVHGVGSQPIWPALHQQGAMALSHAALDYPKAAALADEVLWLPSSTKLTDEQIDFICEVIVGSAR